MTDAQRLLSALGEAIGIHPLNFNDDGVCRLMLDGVLVIDIELQPDKGLLLLHSVVGPHPGDNLALCHQLLSANLFGRGTGEATLALDEQRDELLLFRTIRIEGTTPSEFVAAVESFSIHADYWTSQIMEAVDPSQDSTRSASGNLEGDTNPSSDSEFIPFIRV